MRLLAFFKFFIVAAVFVQAGVAPALSSVTAGPPTFSQPVDYGPEVTGAQYVTIGDVLHRGISDLVVTHANDNFGHVSLLLGTGRGTFGLPRRIFLGTIQEEVVRAKLADVNGDGNPDLVILTRDNGGGVFITVALGDGKGGFRKTSQTRVNVNNLITDFVVAKFRPDPFPDVFVQAPFLLPAFILRSDGRGGFSTVLQLPYGGGAGGLVAADVNHDGLLDLIGIGQSPFIFFTEQLQTLFGTGDGRFFAAPRYSAPGLQESQSTGNNTGVTAAAGDLRSSGNTDLVVFGADSQFGLSVVGQIYLGHADGSFDPPLLLPIAARGVRANAAAVADLNGDGIPDIVIASANPGPSAPFGTYILRGVGDGTFPVELQTQVPVAPLFPSVTIADLNGDGRPDIVITDQTSNRGVWVLLNTTLKRQR
ncbi:MAG: VCBS repeat-containing protein [Candidatus Eremiobacteraeota bacterium]|nr:VCBS repeat-containing protein [Candidatus Eremiobacteraeota bacterium]